MVYYYKANKDAFCGLPAAVAVCWGGGGGVCLNACLDTHTPGCGPGDTPLGVGLETPPGVGLETPQPDPSTSPLAVGLETPPSQTSHPPPGVGLRTPAVDRQTRVKT